MQRTLRVGPRPLIIIGSILVPFLAVACYQAFLGEWNEATTTFGCLLLGALFFASQLYFLSIRIDDEKISIHGWLGEKAKVYFRDITRTHVNALFEKDFPMSIDIYCSDQASPAMVIRSKSLRKPDIAWLLSLPELRVEDEVRAQK
jgi:hypothetical protein